MRAAGFPLRSCRSAIGVGRTTPSNSASVRIAETAYQLDSSNRRPHEACHRRRWPMEQEEAHPPATLRTLRRDRPRPNSISVLAAWREPRIAPRVPP